MNVYTRGEKRRGLLFFGPVVDQLTPFQNVDLNYPLLLGLNQIRSRRAGAVNIILMISIRINRKGSILNISHPTYR